MNATQLFKNLHQQETSLLIGKVWDGQSTKVLEGLRFQALATSSAALQQAGVKRISMGNFANKFIYKELEKRVSQVAESRNFSALFN